MVYTIRNWREFQHYKDRNPPWIKLHFSLLSSKDWVMLADASRVLAVACMLMASRSDGEIDGSEAGLAYLQRVAYLHKIPDLKPLIDCGFLECASKTEQMLQNARPETEVQDLTETEKKQQRARKYANGFALPDWIPDHQWSAWIEARTKKRNPPTEFAKRMACSKLAELQRQGHDPAAVLAQSAFHGWAGLFPIKEPQR